MTFVQGEFVAFFAVVWAAWWALGRSKRARNLLLVAAAAVFYGWVHPGWVALLFGTALLDWTLCRAIERDRANGRLYVAASALANLGVLAWFKYTDFAIRSVADAFAVFGWQTNLTTLGLVLPVGLSFYTFQSLGSVIDVYRGAARARSDVIDWLAYATFFPQLVAGPIERVERLLPQLERAPAFDPRRIFGGLVLATWGAARKVAVADQLASYVDNVFVLRNPPLVLTLAASAAFAVQLYADFGGYTDIARGTARMLGIELSVNFERPLLSTSPADFWRRWHRSLSEWIRDYLLVPLIGDSVSFSRYAIATVVAFLVMGLWHGASWNFVLLGLLQGVLVVGSAAFGRWWPGLRVPGGVVLLPVAYHLALSLPMALLFREHHLDRLWRCLFGAPAATHDDRVTTLVVLCATGVFGAPVVLGDLLAPLARRLTEGRFGLALQTTFAAACLAAIFVFRRVATYHFIYFQF